MRVVVVVRAVDGTGGGGGKHIKDQLEWRQWEMSPDSVACSCCVSSELRFKSKVRSESSRWVIATLARRQRQPWMCIVGLDPVGATKMAHRLNVGAKLELSWISKSSSTSAAAAEAATALGYHFQSAGLTDKPTGFMEISQFEREISQLCRRAVPLLLADCISPSPSPSSPDGGDHRLRD